MRQLHVRDLPDSVHMRLAVQAAAEGVSLAEWVRSSLENVSQVFSPAEARARAAENRSAGRAQSLEDFDETMRQIAKRRVTA